MKQQLFTCLSSLLVFGAVAGASVSVPDPDYLVTFDNFENGAETQAFYRAPGSYSLGPATASVSPTPTLTATTSAESFSDRDSSLASIGSHYYYSIVGPNVPMYIPVLISENMHATSSGGGAGYGEIDVTDNLVDASVGTNYNSVNCSGDCVQDYSGTIRVQAQPNQINTIYLRAGASASNIGKGTGFADPVITIDPAFADASSYTVVVSNTVGNDIASVSGAPEPAYFGIIGSAIAAVVLLRRRNIGQ